MLFSEARARAAEIFKKSKEAKVNAIFAPGTFNLKLFKLNNNIVS